MKQTDREKRRVRIEDVAALAGTSPITVSRALRQPELLAPQTRRRVLDAVEALGYIPDLSARSLASRRSGFAALLVPTVDNQVFAETFQGVAASLAAANLQLFLGDYGYSETRERKLLHALLGRKPEALIFVGIVRDQQVRALLRASSVPIVETWDLTGDPIDSVVGFSNAAAGHAIARHLLAKGRRRIAFVGGVDARSRARGNGLRRALREQAGARVTRVTTTSDISIHGGRAALRETLDEAPETDAVCFATDVLAAGGLLECQRRGVAVPGEVALTGLGDLEIARELIPSLTTVRIPSYLIGLRAGEIVKQRLSGNGADERVVDVGFEIVEREST